MNGKYLVVNCGSSSLKFSLYDMPEEIELINGYIEKIGFKDSFWTVKYNGNKTKKNKYIDDHGDAVKIMIDELLENKVINSLSEIKGVGHRVLHGGEKYSDSVIIDDNVLSDIVSLTNLGPLHHPGEISGIKAIFDNIPSAKNVAVFDTAFHQTMPKYNYMYAVPYEWYEKYKVRRYGFHGTSHKYITLKMMEKLGRDDINLIICHVGSGASVTCVKNGKCYDTSMGLTPLDGLIMGTRCGEVDPSIIKFMYDEAGMNVDYITDLLNKKSGLFGICGKNDFRDVMALCDMDDELGKLAYKMFMDSIIKHIAEYYFELEGKLDAIVFCAGVLENNVKLREDIVNSLSGCMRLKLDIDSNNNIGYGHDYTEGIITTEDSDVSVYVIPTNEEVMIVRDTYRLVNSGKGE